MSEYIQKFTIQIMLIWYGYETGKILKGKGIWEEYIFWIISNKKYAI